MVVVPHGMSNPIAERHLFSSSDDDALMKEIQITHVPDGREFLVKPLLDVVEDIFNCVGPTAIVAIAQQPGVNESQGVSHNGFSDIPELISYTIDKVSLELANKCCTGGDAKTTTLEILQLLSSHSWDTKVLLSLTAFAVNYADFWLVSPLHHTNVPLVQAVACLKQLPDFTEHAEVLKPKFEALKTLIRENIEVAKCIVQFKELPSQYISPDTPETLFASARIPTAVYWTIRSIVACSSQVMGFIGMGNEYVASSADAWELSSLTRKVESLHELLKRQLTRRRQEIDERRHLEEYQTLVRQFETSHVDNTNILKALIYAKDHQLPLYDSSTKSRASIDVLRGKNVLLYISDLEIPADEFSMIKQIYVEARQSPTRTESQCEVVWLPVVDLSTPWNDAKQNQFENLRSMMPWYSVNYHPQMMLDLAVVRYIKEVWHFNKKPLLVVLDPQGKVVNPNAIHMMLIWGSTAYPFTMLREEELWEKESWGIKLLVESIDPQINNWIQQGKYICLYGGEDIDWIRRFVCSTDAVARAAKIQVEFLYVGKSNSREKMRKIKAIIEIEKLGHVMHDLKSIWFFWVRLESMWLSKVQHNKTVENDPIMQEIVTMLSFDGSDQGWAVISGEDQIAKAKGWEILMSMGDFEHLWRKNAAEKGFVHALNDYLRGIQNPTVHCNRLILPGTGGLPEKVVCKECGRFMDKFVMYSCCNE